MNTLRSMSSLKPVNSTFRALAGRGLIVTGAGSLGVAQGAIRRTSGKSAPVGDLARRAVEVGDAGCRPRGRRFERHWELDKRFLCGSSTCAILGGAPSSHTWHLGNGYVGTEDQRRLIGSDQGTQLTIGIGLFAGIIPKPFSSKTSVAAMASMASDVASPPAADVPIKSALSDSGVAVLTLDRPRALNAMSLDMDLAYKKLLDSWSTDPEVHAVLVEGGTPRAFCSGMDVKWTASVAKSDPNSYLVPKVFAAEYVLICAISRFPKPYISLMDGITMGFGLGLSGHGRYRIITERTVMAMPENGIGLFPDVGFAHLMADSPGGGAIGMYMALTGARINTPEDIMFCGLASHYVPSESLPALREEILRTTFSTGGRNSDAAIEAVLDKFAKPVGRESQFRKLLPSIERCFGQSVTVKDTVQELQKETKSTDEQVALWAKQALQGLSKGAPFSLVVTQRHFSLTAGARAAGMTDLTEIEGVMRTEYRLAMRTATRSDFIEGVRAVLVDKDQKPEWKPATLEEVDALEVEGCFKPFSEKENELQVW